MKRVIILLMVLFLVLSLNGLAFAIDKPAPDASVSGIVGDVLCVIPQGFVETVLGEVFYVISLPVTIPLEKKNEVREFLVTDPYDYYFKRPLGEM